jgi:hypothetical protein
MMKNTLVLLLLSLSLGLWAEGQAEKPDFAQTLLQGSYSGPIEVYQSYLRGAPEDLKARGELGILQAIDALEFFAQGLLQVSNISSRMWLPEGWELEEKSWDYNQFTRFLQTFVDKLSASQKSLSMVREGDFKIPFALGTAGFDFTGDGVVLDNERLVGLMGEFDLEDVSQEDLDRLTFNLDLSDLVWLEGYVSLLKGTVELILWYDLSDIYYQFFPMFFSVEYPSGWKAADLSNYTIRLRDAGKGAVAQKDFLRMLSLGQELWDYILAETDDDREWISSPQQTSPFEDFQSSPQVIESWKKTLSLWSQVLRGVYVLEMEDGYGFNLDRFLNNPKPIPTDMMRLEEFVYTYAEKGNIIDPDDLVQEMSIYGDAGWLFGLWAN